MIVKSYYRYGDYREFDPDAGTLAPVESSPGTPIAGMYDEHPDATAVVFYREDGQLWLHVGDVKIPADDLELEWRLVGADETRLEWRVQEDGAAELTIRAPNLEPIVLSYPSGPSGGVPLAKDPTPFISYEDWDFGLFIKNILADDRKTRIFTDH